ncbi:hypothetical protein [Paenibacillus sp. NPDC057967]|uniref:hypothetical protein n=1 Tax=Paenibacillus sp. NPDC057967 TaxID=3346293 RepID=UPI0036DA64E4
MSKKMKSIMMWTSLLILLSAGAIYFMTGIDANDAIDSVTEQSEAVSETLAMDYYVSPQGKDTNLGTRNAPLASI